MSGSNNLLVQKKKQPLIFQFLFFFVHSSPETDNSISAALKQPLDLLTPPFSGRCRHNVIVLPVTIYSTARLKFFTENMCLFFITSAATSLTDNKNSDASWSCQERFILLNYFWCFVHFKIQLKSGLALFWNRKLPNNYAKYKTLNSLGQIHIAWFVLI